MNRKIKLKESIYILEESDDTYVVIFTATRRIKKFKVDGLVKRLIHELKDEKTELDLFKGLNREYPPQDVSDCIASMESQGLIRRYGEKINERHSKQILFLDELTGSWEETLKLQRRITSSVISVFGVGGIGTWIVNGLYQIGVGEIKVSDPDKISPSNLNRQLFFTSQDIGDYKVEVIKRKLPDANIITFKKSVSEEEDLEEIVLGSNFLVNCADEPSVAETTRIIDSYSRKHSIPYCVAGGYNMHLGMIGPIIIPGVTKTFDNFLEYQKSQDPLTGLNVIKDIEKTGSFGPIAGAVANIQLMEIVKHLIGKGNPNYNRFAEVNFMDLDVEWRNF